MSFPWLLSFVEGYWCYFPNSCWYIVSNNVSFFKIRPFFPSTLDEPNNYGHSQSFSLEVMTFSIAPTPIFIPTLSLFPPLRTYQRRTHLLLVLEDLCTTLLDSPSLGWDNMLYRNPNHIYDCHLDYRHPYPTMLLWFPWILCIFLKLQVKLCLTLYDDKVYLIRKLFTL